LAKEDKVGRNRKGKEKCLLPDTQKTGPERFKMVVVVPDIFVPSRQGDSTLNPHLAAGSPSNHQSFHFHRLMFCCYLNIEEWL
jgi:hypothetical protein